VHDEIVPLSQILRKVRRWRPVVFRVRVIATECHREEDDDDDMCDGDLEGRGGDSWRRSRFCGRVWK